MEENEEEERDTSSRAATSVSPEAMEQEEEVPEVAMVRIKTSVTRLPVRLLAQNNVSYPSENSQRYQNSKPYEMNHNGKLLKLNSIIGKLF